MPTMRPMITRPAAFVLMNAAGDKVRAREQWLARFNNRKATTPRAAKKAVEIRAAAAADTTDILLYDEIGPWGIEADDFITTLATITTPNICVRINSPGGDVFDGLAIYNALANHKAAISCVVDGLAASAASFIAMAGSTVSIHESAMMMIHRGWGFAIGNRAAMQEMADILAKIDNQLADIYAKQTGKTSAAMLALMEGNVDGTWFTAQEAADQGLVDEIIQPGAGGDNNPVADPPDSEEGDDPEDPEMAKALAKVAMMRRRLALAQHD